MTSRPFRSGSTRSSSSGTPNTPHLICSCAQDSCALAAVYRAFEAVHASRFRTAYSGSGSGISGRGVEQLRELLPRRLAACWNVLARPYPIRCSVRGKDLTGDRLAVHLVGAVVDAGRTRVSIHLLEWKIARIAQRTVDLDRPVDHVVQHLRAEELDQ